MVVRVFPSIATFAIYLHAIKVEVYNNYAIVSSWQVEWKKSWFGVIYTSYYIVRVLAQWVKEGVL